MKIMGFYTSSIIIKETDMETYISNAKKIYQAVNEQIIAYGVRKSTGKTYVRLHVVDSDNNLSEPIELSRSQIDSNISVLMDYINIGRRELRELKNFLKIEWFSLPTIAEYKNLGFQRDNNNTITGYMGAKCYDSKGNELSKDLFSNLPICNGNLTEIVTNLNKYMASNIKRQIVLAHALSGAICGLVDRNIILSLVGESSTGKTTLQKLGVSFFAQSDYSGTVLKWSSTENALIKRLDGLSGVNVLIDDTQLSKTKHFAPIIYSFENGQSIDRLIKGNELAQRYHWSVSIGITAEKSLLDTFSDLGAVARMIEIPVCKNELFDDEKEVRKIQKLYNNSYGIVGTALVQRLLNHFSTDDIKSILVTEGTKLCRTNRKRISDNNILKRHLESDIAIILLTAKYANEYLHFSFDINKLKSALLDICEENQRTFDENKFENIIADSVYTEILTETIKAYPNHKRNGRIVVPSDLMKAFLLRYSEELHVKSAKVKSELARQGLLSERNGTYCWNHTIDGKNVTGYELIIKQEKSNG